VEKVKNPTTNKYEQKVILNLSPKFPVEKALWPPLCQKIERLLNPRQSVSLFSDDSPLDNQLDEIAALIVKAINDQKAVEPEAILDPAEELVKMKDIIPISATAAGGELLALKAIADLNIIPLLRKMYFTEKEIKLAIAQIVARMLHPASEAETTRWLLHNSSTLNLIGLDDKDCYEMSLHRTSDKLRVHKSDIEDCLFNNDSLLRLPRILLFYDLTNSFFEGTAKGIDKAKRGFSKEKRYDCPLISIALCIDSRGNILKSQFLPGNVSEPATFPTFLEMTSIQPGDMVAMDKGIATKNNMEWLEDKELFFVAADRRMKREFDPELAEEFKTAAGSIIRAYRVEDDAYPGRIKLLCHSLEREAKEISMIKKSAQKLEDELTSIHQGLSRLGTRKGIDYINRRIGRLLQKYSVAGQYYDITVVPSELSPQIASSLLFEWNEKKGSKSELPGVYSLITNNSSMLDSDILNTYLRLTEIESVFRCLKSELGLRPNYHKIGPRVEGHIFISILAYQVTNYIRKTLGEKGIHDSWTTIRNTAEQLKLTMSIGKANRCNKAVMKTAFTGLMDTVSSYFEAMGIDNETRKPRYKYVNTRLWDFHKAANY
jgi:transposase